MIATFDLMPVGAAGTAAIARWNPEMLRHQHALQVEYLVQSANGDFSWTTEKALQVEFPSRRLAWAVLHRLRELDVEAFFGAVVICVEEAEASEGPGNERAEVGASARSKGVAPEACFAALEERGLA